MSDIQLQIYFHHPLDLKAKEKSNSEEVEGKDVETKSKEPRRRKLSAEMIKTAIQRKASSISNWTGQWSPQKVKGATDTLLPPLQSEKAERKKIANKKLTPIPSVDIPSDSEADLAASPNGKGILKKASNVELPNLELFQSVHREDFR